MTVYEVIYHVEISAKNKKDMERKAEVIGEKFTKTLHKRVIPIGYQKKDLGKGSSVQEKLL